MVGDVGMQIWAWHPGLDQISAKDDSIWHENFEQQPPSADSGAIIGPKKKKKQKVTAALQLFSFASEIAWQTSKPWLPMARLQTEMILLSTSRCIRTVNISWSSDVTILEDIM